MEATFRLILNPTAVWQRLRTSKFATDAGKALASQVVGRAIAFFASAYAMRSLGPKELGVGAFILSVVAQMAVLGDLGLNISGVRGLGNLPERRNETISLVWGLRLRAAMGLSALTLLGAWLFGLTGGIGLWFLATPVLVLTVLNPQWIFQGMEHITSFNVVQFTQTLITAGMYFALFRPGVGAALYITVALIAQALSWALAYCLLRRHIKVEWHSFDWHNVWKMVWDSRHAFAIALTVSVYTGLDIVLITFLLSPEKAGLYRAAQGITGVITPILSVAGLIIYPRLIAWKNSSLQEFVRRAVTLALILMGVAIVIDFGAILTVPIIFHALLGPGFEAGIVPCVLLFVARGFTLVGAVPAWGLLAYKLDSKQLMISLSAALLSVTLNFLLIPRFGIAASASVNLLSELIIFVSSAVALYKFTSASRAGFQGRAG